LGTLKKTSSINDRYLGYYKAMMESGYENLIAKIDDRNGGLIFRTYDLPDPLPTAFLCNNDNVAYRLINQLKSLGYDVPGDISVMGFDDVLYSRISVPKITTVRVSRTQMADKSFNLLLDKIDGKTKYTRREALDCFIKERASTKAVHE
jgi:LacI family transcriptional regulator